MEIEIFYKILKFTYNTQWKTDFLPIFSPIFQDFCHFMYLRNIPTFFGLVWGTFDYFRLGGGLYKPLHIMHLSIYCPLSDSLILRVTSSRPSFSISFLSLGIGNSAQCYALFSVIFHFECNASLNSNRKLSHNRVQLGI